ncbi:MobA/MobL family protein, partial [Ruegeria lacuscaerulensis]|uniref:MobA/MobL family protein n=1 Tax=Ruegeria lacuscaerulensis TaxID=55218 RepID=UPI0014802351
MAIYHLSVKTVSRAKGRSATAAAAYRAGVEIADERTGEVHDYTRKSGVGHTEIILPRGAAPKFEDRSTLWNAAEQAERRKNSTVAREYEVALPAELSAEERKALACEYGHWLAERFKVGVDVAIHEPNKEGDQRNHHAH